MTLDHLRVMTHLFRPRLLVSAVPAASCLTPAKSPLKTTSPRPLLMLAMLGFFVLAAQCIFAPALFAQATEAGAVPGDVKNWAYWRGPNFDGTSATTGLPESWNPKGGEGSNLLWKTSEFAGRSTPVVFNGKLYTTLRAEPGTSREGERVVCLDAKTGEFIWENRFNVWLSDVPDTRIGWSSVTVDPETGNVYCLAVCDYFLCIDGETGKTIWGVPLHEQFGMLSTYGGRTNFPVVFEDLVIISGVITNWGDRAKPNHRFIAFDKRTGECVWFNGTVDQPDDTTYSGPSIVTIDGQKTLVVGVGDGSVWAFQPRTGRPLAHYKVSIRGLFTTPLVTGNTIFASHSEENVGGATMGSVESINIAGVGANTKMESKWRIEQLMVGRAAPLLIEDRLYVINDTCKMFVLDSKTGETIGNRITLGDRKQYGSMLYADDKIYVLTENGYWAILKPTEDGAEIIDKGSIRGESFNASPIVADGRLYFLGNSTLYCVGLSPDGPTTFDPKRIQEPLPEWVIASNPKPAQVQLIPAEAQVKPGETIEFKVRLFNDLGQRIEDVSPESIKWSVTGPGKIDGLTFTADADASHAPCMVTATIGELKGESRIRVTPPLPWKFTFDGLTEPPATWIGARYRHVVRTIDDSPALVKIVTIPKGARSRAWFGPSDLSNYTIVADVKGSKMQDKLPDIGLIGQGYELDLMGESQQLQIRSWSAILRMAKETPYTWYPDRWYRLKLRTETSEENGKPIAILRGKVWPRDEPEPKEWTVTAKDESPQMTGAPGLYGNAKDAEFYLDNLEVMTNE